eukprot:299381_1
MEALTQQNHEELKSDEAMTSKFQPSTKNHSNKSYISIEPTDTDDGNDEDSTDIHAMRLETELVELYDSDDDDEKTEQVMIEKQVEFEGYTKNKCCYKCCKCVLRFKLLLFITIWLIIGLGIASIVTEIHDKDKGTAIAAFVVDISIMLACIIIGKLLTWIILKIVKKSVSNSSGIFYIKGIHNRLCITIVSLLWLLNDSIINQFTLRGQLYTYTLLIVVTSSVFLCTHILIRHAILNVYFIRFFGQKARQLKAQITFIKIMLNTQEKKAPFNIPIVDFLLDFPPTPLIKGYKRYKGSVAFKFEIDQETDDNLYSIDLSPGSEPKIIKDTKLKDVCGGVAAAIMKQLHQRKTEILAMPKYMNKSITPVVEKTKSRVIKQRRKLNLLDDSNSDHDSLNLLKLRSRNFSFHAQLSNVDNESINEEIFMVIFKEFNQPNKLLLYELSQLAWKTFTNNGHYRYLNATILKANINKIMTELLTLKKCIDSYIDVINNLQLVTDIVTPIALLFVYLRLLGFDFSEAIAIYVSCFAIIGFFGSAYFSSLFISMSFIVTTNPFLVGDYVMYENEVYLVKEISLLSCTFTQMSNRYSITFQNRQLAESSVPIINFTRSGKQKYKWTVYFKIYEIDDESIYKFVDAIKDRVKERIKYHSTDENTLTRSFCTKDELEDIQWWTIKAKVYELDVFGRKKVKVQMKYFQYSSHVQTLCFNCVTAVMKDFNIKAEPIPVFHYPEPKKMN